MQYSEKRLRESGLVAVFVVQYGDVIDNDPPPEIRCNQELDDLFIKIQEMFDSCFIDTPKEFTAKGFGSDEYITLLLALVQSAEEMLRREAGDMYLVENHINL